MSRYDAFRLVSRDLNLLQWLNNVGFATIDQVALYLNVARSTAYIRAKKLQTHGYLTHTRVFHGTAGIYRLTTQGVQACGSTLPSLKQIPLATYQHDLRVTTLSLLLMKRFEVEVLPERWLRHGLGLEAFGQFGHVPDGVIMHGERRIAIEVELTSKGRRRREQIFKAYLKDFSYHAVWYFCGSATIYRQLEPFIGRASFLSLYYLSDFLSSGEAHGWPALEAQLHH